MDVDTSYGLCRGFLAKDGCAMWRGVPFASVKERFTHSVAPSVWTGVRECTKFGKQAIQFGAPHMTAGVAWNVATKKRVEVIEPPRSMSEECLFLNISSPPGASPEKRYPVMMWVHGGAFMFGSGADGIYRGCDAQTAQK